MSSLDDLSFLDDNSIDFVFASNLFEHVSHDEFAAVLKQPAPELRPEARSRCSAKLSLRFSRILRRYTHKTIYSPEPLRFFAGNRTKCSRQAPFLPLLEIAFASFTVSDSFPT